MLWLHQFMIVPRLDIVVGTIQVISMELGTKENVYTTTAQVDRTFFIVDLARLKHETDTLENAKIVYRPEADFKRYQYEQRCSQLIGLALCTMNFTGKYPRFVRLRGTGFAVRMFGQHCIMALSGRPDEPSACVVQYLNYIHDAFMFYYHSPNAVMKTSQGDGEIFSKHMSAIFNNIIDSVLIDQHTVPAMFNPLPYLSIASKGKESARLFLLATRVLKTCQQHYCIIGGCLLHNKEVLCSQFPPALTEKLMLVGRDGIELNRKSILEENITPDKVWVIDVFLTEEQEEMSEDVRSDLPTSQATYASLKSNPHLTTSTLLWRFQPSGSSRGRGHWRKKPILKTSQPRTPSPLASPKKDTQGSFDIVPELTPAATSTPTHKSVKIQSPSGSMRSEDAIVISPGFITVSYSPKQRKKNVQLPEAKEKKPESGTNVNVHTAESQAERGGIAIALSNPSIGRNLGSEPDSLESRSSDSFATPSPTFPSDITTTPGGTIALGLSNDTDKSSLFQSAVEFSQTPMKREVVNGELETSSKRSTLTPDEDLSLSHETKNGLALKLASRKTDALPSTARNWRFKDSVSDSEDDSDFVESTELERMVLQTKLEKVAKGRAAADKSVTGAGKEEDGEGHREKKAANHKESGSLETKTETDDKTKEGTPTVVTEMVLPNGDVVKERSEGESPDDVTPTESKSNGVLSGATHLLQNGTVQQEDSVSTNSEVHPDPDSAIGQNSEIHADSDSAIGQNGEVHADPDSAIGQNGEVHADPDSAIGQNGEVHPDPDSAIGQNGEVHADSKIGQNVNGNSTSTSERQEAQTSSSSMTTDTKVTVTDEYAGEDSEPPQDKLNSPGGIDIPPRSLYLNVEDSLLDGMMTPVEMTLNQSTLSALRLTGITLPEALKDNDSDEYSSLPEEEEEEEGRERSSDDRRSSVGTTTSGGGASTNSTLRTRAGSWISHTLERCPQIAQAPQLEHKCLYIQRYMNTVIVLLADPGMHQDHGVLNALWQSLLPQLMELESGLKKGEEERSSPRPSNNYAIYSDPGRICEAKPVSAAYHFRHALRRAHQEYMADPSLVQIGLSKEHCRMLSQRVFQREVYFQPGRLGHVDAISIHSVIERGVKTRQWQRTNNIMFV